MKIRKICVVSFGYPTEKQPWFSFVDQLLCAMSELNVECTVIAPQSVTKTAKDPACRRKRYWERKYNNKIIKVHQPYYISLSTMKYKGNNISDIFFEKAVMRCFEHMQEDFDLIYGHFWMPGLIAAKIAKKNNIPCFVACGESVLDTKSLKRNWKYKQTVNGVICVSSKAKKDCVQLGLCSSENAKVFPNGIDTDVFYRMNKEIIRKELHIGVNDFVVSFVGSFTDRKGSLRLSKALNKFNDVYSIFVGSGDAKPRCNNILFCQSVPHEKIPFYLNASDVFVLPTLNEGCCNAIVEAMSCGLPIISSNRSFNDDILDETNSLRIDPMDIDEIYAAIKKLKDDRNLRIRMSENSIRIANKLTVRQRAKNILDFMSEKMVDK